MEALLGFLLSLLVWLGIVPKPDFHAQRVSDRPPPESMREGIIYIVGGENYQKWACFRCPADKNEIIQLSLMPNRRPRWTIGVDILGRPSVHPSVWQQDGSHAHFWIKGGRVVWCPDSGKRAMSRREVNYEA
jgi:hypothetical protein